MAESRACKGGESLLKPLIFSPAPVRKYLFHPKEATFHLSRAFAIFSAEVQKLTNAYTRLQESWKIVNQELEKKIEELAKITQHVNATFRHITEGILAIQLDGTIYSSNEAAQELLKVSVESALGKKIDAVFPNDSLGFSIKEALSFGLAPKIIYKTYQEKLLEISPIFLSDGPKSQQGLIILLKDISEISQLQMALDKNERMVKLGEMITTVAHEIRNPLGGIRGYAALLFRDLKDSPHLQEMAEFVLQSSHHLERLVGAALQYARPVKMNVRPVELGQFLRQLVKFVKMDPAFSEEIQINLHIPFRSLILSIDPEAIKSALLNLIFNGAHAIGKTGTLTIALIQRETSCLIEISDTGVGMSEEEKARLFSPFYTTKKTGSGLGLVEVQKIVQAHMGSIDVRSTPHRGSTFTITLPLKR